MTEAQERYIGILTGEAHAYIDLLDLAAALISDDVVTKEEAASMIIEIANELLQNMTLKIA